MARPTDVTGHYQLIDVPIGEYTLVAKMIGYKIKKEKIVIHSDETLEIKFEIEEDIIRMDEVVITGTKTFKRQTESAVIVNVLDSRTIENVAANTVSEGLNFQPGLRMETDCQTCNYSQLRMNGLGGAYSQVLINSRPVFSALAGLYGLEQMPAEMVERIEVVRGGGSALYGSSAVGGTVNIITKLPQRNSFQVSSNNSVINGQATDYLINATITALAQKRNAGISVYTSHRQRGDYDHNNDGFSELPSLTNNSFGFNSFFRLNENQKIEANFSSLHEYRYGGEIIEGPAYLAKQSEERTHNILMGGINYELISKNNRTFTGIYIAGQSTKRKHYTGIAPSDEQELSDFRANPPYGTSKNYTFVSGIQVNHTAYDFFGGTNILTFGAEYKIDDIYDIIKSYDYLIDQVSKNAGFFAQSDWDINSTFTLLTGIRADKHNFVDQVILNPRISMLIHPTQNTQIRASWATGFRAPEAFDADMHIAFAGGGIQTIQLADDLEEEKSQSWSLSLNYDKPTEKHVYGFTAEGFYTKLSNTFILEEIGTSETGNSILEKHNGGTSAVYGATFEARGNYNRIIQLEAGITLQKSEYSQEVAWSEELPGIKTHLRSPDAYGFYTLSWTPKSKFKASLSGIYTGNMLVPHYGLTGDAGTLRDGYPLYVSHFLGNKPKGFILF